LKQGRRAWKGELKEIAHVRATRLILLALGAAFLAVTSCLLDSGGDIHGIDGFVSDNQGRPVAGVVIRKTGAESGSTYTRADGYYWIGVNPKSLSARPSPGGPSARGKEYSPILPNAATMRISPAISPARW
jgi:hypothetical protein